jgi:hypothetical protein
MKVNNNPIYQYSDTGIVKDGEEMHHQDACKDIQCLQRKVFKLEKDLDKMRVRWFESYGW